MERGKLLGMDRTRYDAACAEHGIRPLLDSELRLPLPAAIDPAVPAVAVAPEPAEPTPAPQAPAPQAPAPQEPAPVPQEPSMVPGDIRAALALLRQAMRATGVLHVQMDHAGRVSYDRRVVTTLEVSL